MASLKISKATKKYDKLQVIHGIDLEIEDGEFCVFVGHQAVENQHYSG